MLFEANCYKYKINWKNGAKDAGSNSLDSNSSMTLLPTTLQKLFATHKGIGRKVGTMSHFHNYHKVLLKG